MHRVPLGNLEGYRADRLAIREMGGETGGIVAGAVGGQQDDAMPLRQLPNNVETALSSARIERPEPADVDPENAHVHAASRRTTLRSSPSRKIRCHISRLTRSQSRSPCSRAPLRCSSARRCSMAGSNN